MQITIDQLKDLTVGAVSVFENETGFRFRRLTDRQIDIIYADDPRERNLDTTGIRVDFHTDASELAVTFAANGKYEVLVNDQTVYCQRIETLEQFRFSLEGTDNRVTIILPSHCEGALSNICLECASYVRRHDYSCKLAFYGDSITQGWNSEKDSQSYAWLTSRFFNAESRIYGIGGTTFIPDFPEDTGFRPDAVIVAMGTNDFGRQKTMEQIQADCAAYLKNVELAKPGSKLFCITPIWRYIGLTPRAAGTLADVRKEITRIAAEAGYVVIDGLSLVPHQFEYYADKGTHPNDLGFFCYAHNLTNFLRHHL